jgi:hypothetical protein
VADTEIFFDISRGRFFFVQRRTFSAQPAAKVSSYINDFAND